MDPEFWHQRWEENRIGFHQARINLHLERHWPTLGLGGRGRVLVPLCGKTLDMLWLLEQGHEVTGVELSPLAVRAFLEENRLEAVRRPEGRFVAHTVHELTLLEGNFLDLVPSPEAPFAAAWDRASLIALRGDQRPAYVERLAEVLPPGAPVLLVSLEYEEAGMTGPPFSVPESEVRALFSGSFHVEVRVREDALADNPRFRDRGLSRMTEVVTVLTRRS